MRYVAKASERLAVHVPAPEERILKVLLSPVLDPTNQDIACGMTELPAGSCSDLRGHEEGEMFFCLEGSGTVEIDGENHILEKEEAVYVPPFAVHRLHSDRGEMFRLLWVLTPPFGGDRKVYEMAKQNMEVTK